MKAGDKAMSSSAFDQSFNYFNNGLQLLSKESWRTHYDLTLELHNATAEASFCISDYAKMKEIIEEISENVTSKLHLIKSYSLQIQRYKDKRKFEKAISSAICILDYLDENVEINVQKVAFLHFCIASILPLKKYIVNNYCFEKPHVTISYNGGSQS